jgi:thiol-disulfide isomerase/thioredoxin
MRNKLFVSAGICMRKLSVMLLVVGSFISANAIAAAPVVELSADELLAFTKQYKTVVVQLNSSDPKCGYCVGADKIFDQIAEKRYKNPVIFARVQWALWKDFPKFDPSIKIFGMPSLLFFKNGAQTDVLEGGIKEEADIVEVVETIDDFASFTPTSTEESKVLASPHVIELKPEQFQAYIYLKTHGQLCSSFHQT